MYNRIGFTLILLLVTTFTFLPLNNVYGGFITSTIPDTDTEGTFSGTLFAFFDLRDRETFVQVTNNQNIDRPMHIQIFNVADNCNENNFFDLYTVNDTHVYNLRDIETNDGNPSGVVLPDGAYGFFTVLPAGPTETTPSIFGNFRIIDNSGYEYRTNMAFRSQGLISPSGVGTNYYLNFNQNSGVTFSDVVAMVFDVESSEVMMSNVTEHFKVFDIDIYNNNEVPFSCRNVIYSCIDQDSPRQDELLEFASNNSDGSASVASSEYGINDVIPHSRGGELLCPGNNIGEGFVVFRQFQMPDQSLSSDGFIGYVGLNNGNGRGSMDSLFTDSLCFLNPIFCNQPT